MESGSSATDSVTDLTDVTDRWNQEVRLGILLRIEGIRNQEELKITNYELFPRN